MKLRSYLYKLSSGLISEDMVISSTKDRDKSLSSDRLESVSYDSRDRLEFPIVVELIFFIWE